MNPVKVMNDLMEGNGRFREGRSGELERHLSGQKPKVAVLSCSDSRVVLETLFGQDIGDIFAVEVAGNVAYDSSVLQSLEYAVAHLEVPLLLVLGHTGCGAIGLAESADDGAGPLIEEIKACFELDDDHVVANVRRQLKMLPVRSEIISNAASSGKLAVMGAVYDMGTGMVSLV